MGNRIQKSTDNSLNEDNEKKSIFLQFKKLKEVPSDLLTKDDYESIVVDFNQIENLPNLSKYASSLTELSAASNLIAKIPPWMGMMTSLVLLNFGLNKLEKVDDTTICSLTNLQHLLLNSNKLTSLPEGISRLTNLKKVALSQNEIQIHSLKFPPSITELELSGNRLPSFPIAHQLPNITTLDLSENNIQELSEDMLQLANLKKLYLSCNSISSFPKNIQNHWTSLIALRVDFNDFIHFPKEVTEIKQLQSFNINGNPLDEENIKIANAWRSSMVIFMGFEFPTPDLILPNLYLGDWDCAKNKHGLKKLGISHVLTVAEFRPPYPDHFQYKVVSIDDRESENLKSHFNPCVEFIEEGRKKGAVLIHCRAGVSRSASVTIAYIMAIEKKRFEEAHEFVKTKRPFIRPNGGFVEQLREFEKELFTSS